MNHPLDPIAFSAGPIHVHWYGIILGLGTMMGLFLAIKEGKKQKIHPDFFFDFLMIALPSALIGARIYYVIFKWEDYKDNLTEIVMIWHGGIAIYGALIGGILSAVFYVKKRGYDFWKIADICAPSLFIGQIIGRWGNFVNQEAHGGPVEESFLRNVLHLPNFIIDQMNIGGVYYHPTFLYESIWNLIGLFLLLLLRRQSFIKTGELFVTYLIWYSAGRFFIEGLRTDSLAIDGYTWLTSLLNILWSPMNLLFPPGSMAYGNVRISQLIGIFIIFTAIVILIHRRHISFTEKISRE